MENLIQNTEKVVETISQFGLLNYLECLIESKIAKITLHSVFPITAAPNWADRRDYLILQDRFSLINILKNPSNLN